MGEWYLVEVCPYQAEAGHAAMFALAFSVRHPVRDRLRGSVLEWIMVSGAFVVPTVDPDLRRTGGAAWFSATARDLESIPRPRHLFAGATLSEAIRFVESWEGGVYVPIAYQRRARRFSALWKRQYALQRRLTREASASAEHWCRCMVAADRVVRAARTLFLIEQPAATPLAMEELRAALIATGALDPPADPLPYAPTAVAIPVITNPHTFADLPTAAFGTTPKATYPLDAWDGDR